MALRQLSHQIKGPPIDVGLAPLQRLPIIIVKYVHCTTSMRNPGEGGVAT